MGVQSHRGGYIQSLPGGCSQSLPGVCIQETPQWLYSGISLVGVFWSHPGGCVQESPWAVNSSGCGRRDGDALLGEKNVRQVVKLCSGQFGRGWSTGWEEHRMGGALVALELTLEMTLGLQVRNVG